MTPEEHEEAVLDSIKEPTGYYIEKHRAFGTSSLRWGPFSTVEVADQWLRDHPEVGGVSIIPLFLDVDWTR